MTTQKSAPVDRGCAVAVIIFILVLGTLLPWNFFITAMEYFDDRLKGTASSIGSTLVTNGTTPVTNGTTQVTKGTTPVTKDYRFASWMTLLAQLPLLLFTLANSFLYQRWIKEKIRITVSMFSILFLLTAIMASGTKEALFMMQQTDSHSRSSVLAVFKKIWVMVLCVTCVLAVTLSVFPAVTVKVKSVYGNQEWDRYFLCICFFIVFNIMDLIGRSVTSMVQWPSKRSGLFPVLVVSRVVFIPLIMLCNTDNRQYLPVLFCHDIAFLVIMTLFALSNGYFICLCMSYAPPLVRAKDCETAGALMTFFLALGLSLGAALSFLLRNLL